MSTSNAFKPLDRQTARPLYLQIKEEIVARVNSGTWARGRKLPSENELVEMLGVSRMTINRALRELTGDGLLVRVHGVGTFVAEQRRPASLIELRDIADEIREAGREHRLEVLSLEACAAPPDVSDRLELGRGKNVFHLRAVHYQDDVAVLFEDRYVNPEKAPGFLDADFTRTTATGYLVGLYTPDEMEHVVQAISPEPDVAAILGIDPAEACLKLSRRTWKDRRVVTSAVLVYPGSRYMLGARYATDEYRPR